MKYFVIKKKKTHASCAVLVVEVVIVWSPPFCCPSLAADIYDI